MRKMHLDVIKGRQAYKKKELKDKSWAELVEDLGEALKAIEADFKALRDPYGYKKDKDHG